MLERRKGEAAASALDYFFARLDDLMMARWTVMGSWCRSFASETPFAESCNHE